MSVIFQILKILLLSTLIFNYSLAIKCPSEINSILHPFEVNQCTIIYLTITKEISGIKEHIIQEDNNELLSSSLISPKVIKNTNPFFPCEQRNLSLIPERLNWRSPLKILSRSSTCTFILVDLQQHKFALEIENALTSLMYNPKFAPELVKNEDKFLFLTEHSNLLPIYESQTIQKIKYKLILTLPSCNLHQFCLYCPGNYNIQELAIVKNRDVRYEGFDKNYYGSTLQLSTTDKVPQIFEVTKDKSTGKVTAKRGIYASVLKHIQKGLNFTAELSISSGGGGTGTKLANGTWVGIIGDLLNQRADIGFVAAVEVTRFEYFSLCAPVNYAFLGFVTGN
jgi:hypothetical protein